MTLEPAENWRAQALCLGDPEGWFPIGTGACDQEQAKDAKATCRRCPVLAACAEWSLAFRPQLTDGIFAALDGDERRTLWRAADRAATRARRAMTPTAAHATNAKAAAVAAVEEHCQDQRTRVATLTTHGHSATEISRRLGISARTVGRMRAQVRAGAA